MHIYDAEVGSNVIPAQARGHHTHLLASYRMEWRESHIIGLLFEHLQIVNSEASRTDKNIHSLPFTQFV